MTKSLKKGTILSDLKMSVAMMTFMSSLLIDEVPRDPRAERQLSLAPDWLLRRDSRLLDLGQIRRNQLNMTEV